MSDFGAVASGGYNTKTRTSCGIFLLLIQKIEISKKSQKYCDGTATSNTSRKEETSTI